MSAQVVGALALVFVSASSLALDWIQTRRIRLLQERARLLEARLDWLVARHRAVEAIARATPRP